MKAAPEVLTPIGNQRLEKELPSLGSKAKAQSLDIRDLIFHASNERLRVSFFEASDEQTVIVCLIDLLTVVENAQPRSVEPATLDQSETIQ